MLIITKSVYEQMLNAAQQAAPYEACGLLGGKDNTVYSFHELTNADASGEHFSMHPEEQFAAVKDMRNSGCRMLAIWHSHPETPARLSAEDIRLAYTPDVVYVVVSLSPEEAASCRAFVLEEGRPVEDPIAVREVGSSRIFVKSKASPCLDVE